jgi:uncharacterized protein involved in exopolysaccharide biosynthesis
MESTTNSTSLRFDDQTEVGLTDLLDFFWGARWAVLIGAVLGIGLGLLFLSRATYRYTATLVVTPAKSEMAQFPGNLSSLAAITGLSIPSQGSDFNLYLLGLKSHQVAVELAKNDKIMQKLFSGQYDISTGRWLRPSGVMVNFSSAIKSVLRVPGADWKPPGAADLQKFLEANVRVVSDRKTNVVTISFDHKDPEFAAKLITDLNDNADAILRRRTLARADQGIAYLERQLSQVQLAEHRQALSAMLGEQERGRMLASSAAPYAAQPFGAAVVSSIPTSPKPKIVLVVGIFGGAIASLVAMFLGRIIQSVRRTTRTRFSLDV